jgi:hypothetical protein
VVNDQKQQPMPQRQTGSSLPLEDYDSLSIHEIVNKSMELRARFSTYNERAATVTFTLTYEALDGYAVVTRR